MRKYDYTFLKSENYSMRLINQVALIYSYKTKDEQRREKYLSIYSELEKIAKVQSVKDSNEIEGIVSTDERIRSIVNGKSEPLNHDEEEIAGYRDALNLIHSSHNYIELNEKFIINLHKLLFNKSNPDYSGKYKTHDNVIMEIHNDGTKQVRFTPIKSKEVNKNMEQLLLAFTVANNDSSINKLMLIPCFILDFLCIHPFNDGNGRISRLLTLLLLYQNGFDAGKFISFEEQINKNKWDYYEALKESSQNWHENSNNYIYFIENFIYTLFSCYKELDKRFTTVNSKKINKTSRIEATIYNSLLPISKKEISLILPDVSPTTIEYVLSKLLKENKISKVSKGINTKYIVKTTD